MASDDDAEQYEALREIEDDGVNTSAAPDIQTVISRRLVLAGGGAIATVAGIGAQDAHARTARAHTRCALSCMLRPCCHVIHRPGTWPASSRLKAKTDLEDSTTSTRRLGLWPLMRAR